MLRSRTRKFRGILLLGVYFLGTCSIARTGEITVREEAAAKLDRYLTRITPFGFSGALMVSKDGKTILNQGYGMAIRSKDIRNTAETVFSTGSITKQFTAAAIMKLKMEGKLNTSDPIGKILDGVPEDKSNITIRHLLTHTSGLVQDVAGDYDTASRDETVKKILAQPLEFKPGERFAYTNVGYTLLAAIIEKVSGKSYEKYLNKKLFQPAGMVSTGYRLPKWDGKVVAHWYVDDTDNSTPLEKPYPYWNLIGNGGILSTTKDMYRWYLALKGDSILSSDAKSELFTPFLNDYAYGWDVLTAKYGSLIQHNGGSMLGNSAEIRWYVDSNAVTILFCNQSYDGVPLIDAVRDKIENILFGGEVALPPGVMEFDSAGLQKFEGDYRLQSGGHLIASEKNKALSVTLQGQDAINLFIYRERAKLYLHSDINDKSTEIFQSALKGDYEPFKEVLTDKEKRFDRVRRLIDERIRNSEDETGLIQQVVILGTLPSSFEEGAVKTMVELRGERGSIFFRLIWRGHENIGVGPAMSAQTISIPFLPLTLTDFAGYHLGMAKNLRISFNLTNNGSVAGLTIRTVDENVEAYKIMK
ncbi:MAG: serine hydrolase domain-containing protein [Candidatus Zixiibacteriota bacterium]